MNKLLLSYENDGGREGKRRGGEREDTLIQITRRSKSTARRRDEGSRRRKMEER